MGKILYSIFMCPKCHLGGGWKNVVGLSINRVSSSRTAWALKAHLWLQDCMGFRGPCRAVAQTPVTSVLSSQNYAVSKRVKSSRNLVAKIWNIFKIQNPKFVIQNFRNVKNVTNKIGQFTGFLSRFFTKIRNWRTVVQFSTIPVYETVIPCSCSVEIFPP